MPILNKDEMPFDLREWLDIATGRTSLICLNEKMRLRVEDRICRQYYDAYWEAAHKDVSHEKSHESAMASLDDPWKALKKFRFEQRHRKRFIPYITRCDTIEEWLEVATGKLIQEDRERVCEEYRSHYDEFMRDELSRDTGREEANEKALMALGSPWRVRRALGLEHIHLSFFEMLRLDRTLNTLQCYYINSVSKYTRFFTTAIFVCALSVILYVIKFRPEIGFAYDHTFLDSYNWFSFACTALWSVFPGILHLFFVSYAGKYVSRKFFLWTSSALETISMLFIQLSIFFTCFNDDVFPFILKACIAGIYLYYSYRCIRTGIRICVFIDQNRLFSEDENRLDGA